MYAIFKDEHGNTYQRKAKLVLRDSHSETLCSSAQQLVKVYKGKYPDERPITVQTLYSYMDLGKKSRLRMDGLPEGVTIERV